MKSVLGILLLSMFVSLGSLHAAIVSCANTNLAALIALGGGAGNGCTVDDLLFNNFSYTPSAGAPASSLVMANLQSNTITMTYGWSFYSGTGTFNGNFTLGYTVSIITSGPGACPACVMGSVKEQMMAGVAPPDPISISVAETAGLSPIVIDNLTFSGNTSGSSFAGVQTLTKTATTSGISSTNPLASFESSVVAHTPEPGTLSLIGASLLALGFLRRRNSKR